MEDLFIKKNNYLKIFKDLTFTVGFLFFYKKQGEFLIVKKITEINAKNFLKVL